MGTCYTLRCRGCGYEISANLGIGFLFPLAYKGAMKAASEGKLGKTVQQFLQEHPDGALNMESVFLRCPDCGTLKPGPDLSMYIRNPDIPREEQGEWCAAASFEGVDYVSPMELKEENTYILYAPGHICEKCGKPMQSITENDLMLRNIGAEKETGRTVISCPDCGKPLLIDGVMMWD